MNHRFLEDETLTDNLDDIYAVRLLHVLEQAIHLDPDHVDQVVLLIKLLNQASLHDQEPDLIQEITAKLEAKYA